MALPMNTQEIECRFLEIDKDAIVKKLLDLGAKDLGEKMLEEIIFYHPQDTWREQGKFIRLRMNGDSVKLSYKEHREHTVDGAYEIEMGIEDMKKAELFFEKIGFPASRHQQKKRLTFELGEVTFDIDTWPRIPTYIEIEGPSERALQEAAELLGFDWKDAVFQNAGYLITNTYKIPVTELKWFTFERYE